MAFLHNPACHLRVFSHIFPYQEKGGFDASFFQDIQDSSCIFHRRTIIKSQIHRLWMEIILDTGNDARSDLRLVFFRHQQFPFLCIGEKSRLDQTGRHHCAAGHMEIRIPSQLPFRSTDTSGRLLPDQKCQSLIVPCDIRPVIPYFHTTHIRFIRRILMDTHIDVSSGIIGSLYPVLFCHIDIFFPGQNDPITKRFQLALYNLCNGKVDGFFLNTFPLASLIRPSMSRIQKYSRYSRLFRYGLRFLCCFFLCERHLSCIYKSQQSLFHFCELFFRRRKRLQYRQTVPYVKRSAYKTE